MNISENEKFRFELASRKDRELIKEWWTKPHVKEFWDNSPEAWQNVENFLQGRKKTFDYWIGYFENVPFSLIMTSNATDDLKESDPFFNWVAPKGITLTIDFLIGEDEFLNRGFSYLTLSEFSKFQKARGVTRLLIDPEISNSKAIHVYQKAGFEIVDNFIREKGYFSGIKHYVMILNL